MSTNQRNLLHISILVISLGLCLRAGSTIMDLWHRRDIMRVRQAELEKRAQENTRMAAKLEEIKQDEYVEKVARDTLGLVKDGEAIVILPKQGSEESEQNGQKGMPNWQKWWRLFF